MARLILLRHAKSSWAVPGQPDRERELAPRGRRAAEAMAEWLAQSGLLPDRVLCSPARRTRETLAALLPFLPDDDRVTIAPGLYEPPSGDYRRVISELGGEAERLLVVGHNPAIQATALVLAGKGNARMVAEIAAKFPTGGLAILSFERPEWSQLQPHSGDLTEFVRPRDIDKAGEHDDD